MRILIVEDDTLLGEGIAAALNKAGDTADWVTNAEDAWHTLNLEHFDCVLLDLGLPGMDGIELLSTLRKAGKELPVLILTARDAVEDRIAGLDAGADDYLLKPFDLAELRARLRAVTRRYKGFSDTLLKVGGLSIDTTGQQVSYCGQGVTLSRREYGLLLTLAENAGRILERGRLEESLYGWGAEIESNTLEVHIHHLRKKLAPELIRTVRGVGYMIAKAPA
ncbi:MAG: DNA-binding response regulator [Oceanospirillaceae bacterium]|jgi:two-component system response regulator QseB|uniref:response regulator n=1 Tax=Marinobacterium litorale TaxID=404770 RepID=UPI0004076EB8|nr:response regulator [Marinobacterium litorale]MBT00505.1 DNA-binding response regulator [Oceanospirillaceae bacterium]